MSEPSFNSLDDTDDPFNLLQRDLDNIYMPDSLDNPMMSSEFFDSVFSMEQTVNNNDAVALSSLDVGCDFQINSDVDDATPANSCSSPDSEPSYELNDFVILNNKVQKNNGEFFKRAEQNARNLCHYGPALLNNNNNNPKALLHTKSNITKYINDKKRQSNAKQVIRVQSLSGKGGSVLLPFNVADLKKIKIINGKELQAENVQLTKIADFSPQNVYVDRVSSPDTLNDDDEDSDCSDIKMDQDHQYPEVRLTDEEKRLLNKDGIYLPSRYPLTKQEEKDLKRIRRKIRNKVSAQDSRKRKKEYVDGLEARVRQGAEEKKILVNRVKQLEKQKNNLTLQMQKLRMLVLNTTASKATPTTSLLVVLLSVLLVSLPNLRSPQDTEWKEQQQTAVRRTLLASKASYKDVFNMEEFFTHSKDEQAAEFKNLPFEDNTTEEFFESSNFMENLEKNYKEAGKRFAEDDAIKKVLDKYDVDWDIHTTYAKVKAFLEDLFQGSEKQGAILEQNSSVKKKFIEEDIDDEVVPAKRLKSYSVKANDIPSTVVLNTIQKE